MSPTDLTLGRKKLVRRMKKGPLVDNCRNMLNCGIVQTGGLHGPYMQFGRDLLLYGLYEALLYAEQYEHQGYFKEDTVSSIVEYITNNLQEPVA